MPQLSFDHVHYRSKNFDKTRAFYVGIMGATDLGTINLGGKDNLQLALGSVILLFAPPSDDPPKINNDADNRLGAFHIAFLVDDCVAATDYYVSKHAKLVKGPLMANDQIMASFLQAPDDMWVELKQIITSE